MNNITQQAYLIVDIGTGNVRAAIFSAAGELIALHRENVTYEKDADYPDSIYFDPTQLWKQIKALAIRTLDEAGSVQIMAITATSQREGVVVLDNERQPLIGMSNHDNRGREWESLIADKERMYGITGRYTKALFSALNRVGLRERKPEHGTGIAKRKRAG